MRVLLEEVKRLNASGAIRAAFTPTFGGVAAAVFKMALGNGLGFAFADGVSLADLFGAERGTFMLELENGHKLYNTRKGDQYTPKDKEEAVFFILLFSLTNDILNNLQLRDRKSVV